jgi:hypothetical protein
MTTGARGKVRSVPSTPPVRKEFSDSTLEIFDQVLATQQISVGDPTFIETAEKVVKARQELMAAMMARGMVKPE